METYTLNSDIEVMFLTAKKFPDDVPATYTLLEQKITDKSPRNYYGFSHPNKDGIIMYKACAQILNTNEPHTYQLETMTIKAGNYACIFIKNHFENEKNIPNAFDKLLKHPQLDPHGFCLEIYKNFTDPDVTCLVPLIDYKNQTNN